MFSLCQAIRCVTLGSVPLACAPKTDHFATQLPRWPSNAITQYLHYQTSVSVVPTVPKCPYFRCQNRCFSTMAPRWQECPPILLPRCQDGAKAGAKTAAKLPSWSHGAAKLVPRHQLSWQAGGKMSRYPYPGFLIFGGPPRNGPFCNPDTKMAL